MKDSNGVFDIFGSVMGQLEMYISRDGHAINKQKLSPYFNCNYNNYKYMDKNELFLSLLNNIKLFEEKYFQFIDKYRKFEFPQDFQKNEAVQCLHYFSQSTEEGKIKKIISTILEILIKGKKPSFLSEFIEKEKKLSAPNRNYIQNLMYKEPLKLKEEKNYKNYYLNPIEKKSYGFEYSEDDFL